MGSVVVFAGVSAVTGVGVDVGLPVGVGVGVAEGLLEGAGVEVLRGVGVGVAVAVAAEEAEAEGTDCSVPEVVSCEAEADDGSDA